MTALALTETQVVAVKNAIPYLEQHVEEEMRAGHALGPVSIAIGVLREVLAEAEEHG